MPKSIVLRWVEPLHFEIPRIGVNCSVQPPTRGQVRAFFALDAEASDDDETIVAADEKRAKGLAILCEGSDVPLDKLTSDEEQDVLHAIIARHHGFDPGDALALQHTLLKKKLIAAIAASATSQPSTATPSTSAENSASVPPMPTP